MNKKMNYREFIEENIKECDISYRGGTLKIDVSELFPEVEVTGEEAIMGAYQNYLGGGIAGSIQVGRMFELASLTVENQRQYEKLSEALKMYFYDINNGGGDDYMQENVNSYSQNQRLPKSGY